MSNNDQNEEKAKVYDRQSFIGYLAQKRLLESNVLIVGLNGCMAELSKNMILAGANLTLVDDATIDNIDAESNFLFTSQEIGNQVNYQSYPISNQRLTVAYEKLKEINPLVRIEKATLENVKKDLNPFNIVVTSTKSFKELEEWDTKTKEFNKPYYNLVCCGLYGFFYISLGTKFTYEKEKRQTLSFSFGQKIERPKFKQFEEVIAYSLPLKDALTEQYKIAENYSANYIYHCILSKINIL